MEAIILEPKNKEDFEKIKNFAAQNDIPTSILDDEDFRFIERKKLADIADKNYPQTDINMEEIVAIIKESRAEDYAKKISVIIDTNWWVSLFLSKNKSALTDLFRNNNIIVTEVFTLHRKYAGY